MLWSGTGWVELWKEGWSVFRVFGARDVSEGDDVVSLGIYAVGARVICVVMGRGFGCGKNYAAGMDKAGFAQIKARGKQVIVTIGLALARSTDDMFANRFVILLPRKFDL